MSYTGPKIVEGFQLHTPEQLSELVRLDNKHVPEGLRSDVRDTSGYSSREAYTLHALHTKDIEIDLLQKEIKKLKYERRHDSKTGLKNGIALEEDLTQLLGSASLGSVHVVYIDLDEFKKINTAYGHSGGDFALKLAGDCLTQGLRKGDNLYRKHSEAGDEFIVVSESDDRREDDIVNVVSSQDVIDVGEDGAVVGVTTSSTFERRSEVADRRDNASVDALNLIIRVVQSMQRTGACFQIYTKGALREDGGTEIVVLNGSVGSASNIDGDTPSSLVDRSDLDMLNRKSKDVVIDVVMPADG